MAALRPVKNHDGLLKAFAKAVSEKSSLFNEDVCLVLVGEGSLETKLRHLSQSLGIETQVIFLGRRNDIHKVLQTFDVFILNSRTEGMSYAILEAMACGLPVIATDVGANSELITHDTEGYLFPQGDTKSLVNYISQIANDRTRLIEMGKNARKKIIKSYSLKKMISSYKTLYEEVIGESKKQ